MLWQAGPTRVHHYHFVDPSLMPQPKALFFDIFGTIVDWRQGIARETAAILQPLGFALDWFALADAWRGEYQPSMEQVRSKRQAFCKLDVLHRRNLLAIANRFGLEELPEATIDQLTTSWHRLDAWPDVAEGLQRMRAKFLLAPVSNGNISLMVALARRNRFVWDAVLGAEIAQDYKPNAKVYHASAEALDLAPAQCMMVAAHSADLAAAAALGFQTAHVARPHEYGPGSGETSPTVPVVVAATSLIDLAERLIPASAAQ
jgi:2-haloacid dehalogenase